MGTTIDSNDTTRHNDHVEARSNQPPINLPGIETEYHFVPKWNDGFFIISSMEYKLSLDFGRVIPGVWSILYQEMS